MSQTIISPKSITFKREELYEKVWTQPLSKIAEMNLISFASLRKACVQMNIPLPKFGHWERIRRGRPVERELLPSNFKLSEVSISVRDKSKNKVKLLSSENSGFQVSEKLNNPDYLILIAKERLTDKNNYWLHRGLIHTRTGQVGISVAPDNVSRSLRIMDAFIKFMRKRGHSIIANENGVHLIMSEEKVQFYLRETCRKVARNDKWNSHDFVATGKFCFTGIVSWHKHEWSDGKLLVEDKLEDIVMKLEALAFESHQQSLIWKKAAEEAKEKLRQEEELKKLRITEIEKFKDLIEVANRWKQACILREYLKAVKQNDKDSDKLNTEPNTWLDWAHKKIDWFDPLIEGDDDLLTQTDRVSISTGERINKSNNRSPY